MCLVDVSSLEQMKALGDAVFDKFGGQLDFLHLNAGTGGASTCTSTEGWEKILGVNMFGVIYGGQAIASRMIEGRTTPGVSI